MRMIDIICKKRDGKELDKDEIKFFIDGIVSGAIPDYQTSALLMAIHFQGMTDRELADLTLLMAKSGEMVDLSGIKGLKLDKHSSGGVGDKTTMVVAPIVAACGGIMAKMSGRGLGHTGGTIDKLEAIPGFNTALCKEDFIHQVNEIGVSVIGQTGNLAPADKILYALRDVTGTVPNIPLIASSIMSKKLAAGADCILLDVKFGSGAFMKTPESAVELAQKMVSIGENNGRRTAAYVTSMDSPLGQNIGNALEVQEVIDVLRGQGPEDLIIECVSLAASLLHMANKGDMETCRQLVRTSIENGSALEKLREMVKAQGGDVSVIDAPDGFSKAGVCHELKSREAGYISGMNTEEIGIASTMLGAGREQLDSVIDPAAGIVIWRKIGDRVDKGDVLATLYTSRDELLAPAAERYYGALTYSSKQPEKGSLVYAFVDKNGVERL
ncbi:MAG: pyrimidine-nucleoside phosphorylase [Anaerovibrio sp.]|nr:pyrimidine-nucleoside phosphorylase [Anaerovibrio sp.]